MLQKKLREIYVLIDEYDHFANELLSFQSDVFEETISKTGFVRKWYEVLKSGTDNGLIQRIFATGVSPITLDSLTIGFDIGKNKTMDFRFNECLGFTQNEVENLLRAALGDSIDVEKEMPVLRKYYNGYLFSIVTTTLKKFSNRDFMQFNEKYVKIIMITYFMMSRIYYVKSEYEVENGYIDIALLPRPGVKAPYNAIFEVKYIKKSEFTNELLEDKIQSAKEQIAKYVLAPELDEMDNLVKWVFVFCGEELVFEEKV